MGAHEAVHESLDCTLKPLLGLLAGSASGGGISQGKQKGRSIITASENAFNSKSMREPQVPRSNSGLMDCK